MTRAREAARLIGNNTFRLDSNNAVGFNSTTPDAMFDIDGGLSVTGIVTASGGFVGQGGATVTGILTATTFVGALTGAATQVTVADESSDTTCFPLFATAATGNLAPKSGTNLTFNSSTGTLEATNLTLSGDLTVNGTTTTLDTALQEVDLINIQANASVPGLGVTQSGSGAIIAAYDGASEVFRVDDGGSVGIGTDNPSFPSGTGLAIHHSTASRLKLTNDTTGGASGDGAHLYTSGGDFIIENKESANVRFYTSASEQVRIDSSGRLLVNTTSSSSNIAGYANGGIQLNSTTTAQACVNLIHRNNSNNTHAIVLAKARDGGANGGRVQDGDDFGAISFQGFDGTGGSSYRRGAEIRGAVDGTPGNTDMPGRLEFLTTSDGSVVPTERMRITSAGNVSIQNDSGKFTAGAGDDLQIYHDGSQSYIAGDDIRITNNAVSETIAKFLANGAVELNHNDSKKFETTSTGVTVTGDVNSTSDIDLKKDIEVVTSATEMLNQLRGVKFTWKENDEKSVGVIAQEVEAILPELVRGEEGNKSVNYSGLVGVLIEAVKELSARVEELENK